MRGCDIERSRERWLRWELGIENLSEQVGERERGEENVTEKRKELGKEGFRKGSKVRLVRMT